MKSEEVGEGLSSLVTGSRSYSNFASVAGYARWSGYGEFYCFLQATYNVVLRWVETSVFCAFLVVYDVGACDELTCWHILATSVFLTRARLRKFF